MNANASIEPLESRIAPAAVFTFTDVDGDTVKIVTSKGASFDLANAAHVVGGQLLFLDLSNATFGGEFDGANITITAKRGASGDGYVNVGKIDASGRDLGTVSISGDLAKIVCGDGVSSTPSVKSISARSMGLFGTATQAPGGDLVSLITGDLGVLALSGDFLGASFTANGKIGAIKIGGDLRGGDTFGYGRITATSITSVKIGGDLVAGTGDETGKIIAFGNLGKVRIGGSVFGAQDMVADIKGQIYASGNSGPIFIGKDIIGGISEQKAIEILGNAGAITIGGSILADAGKFSGAVYVGGNSGPMKIGRDVKGGAGELSGRIIVSGNVAGFTLGHDLRGGSGTQLEGLRLVQIAFGGSTAPVKIGGDVVGGTGFGSATILLGNGAPSFTLRGSIVGGGSLLVGVTGIPAGAVGTGNTPIVVIGGGLSGSPFNGGTLNAISITKLVIKGSVVGSSIIDSTSDTLPLIDISGNLGTANIGGSVVGPGIGSVVGYHTIHVGGNVGSLQISGSLVGGPALFSGAVAIDGNAGVVKIGGSLDIGTGFGSGNIRVGGRLSMLQVGGSVETGVTAASFGVARITGDILGVVVALTGGFDSITVGGSLGTDVSGGSIRANTTLGNVKIGGSISGSFGGGDQCLKGRNAGNISIGGDVIGRGGTAPLIQIADSAGAISIGGDVRGPAGAPTRLAFDTGFSPARGFASLTVKGSVVNAFISSGIEAIGYFQLQAEASLGPVKVGGNWIASSIVTGLGRGADMLTGTGDDGPIPVSAISRIASITIAGQVLGTVAGGDHFGFVSRNIGPVKIGAAVFIPGAMPIELSPLTDDVTIRVV